MISPTPANAVTKMAKPSAWTTWRLIANSGRLLILPIYIHSFIGIAFRHIFRRQAVGERVRYASVAPSNAIGPRQIYTTAVEYPRAVMPILPADKLSPNRHADRRALPRLLRRALRHQVVSKLARKARVSLVLAVRMQARPPSACPVDPSITDFRRLTEPQGR
jgi:hypothetical protein